MEPKPVLSVNALRVSVDTDEGHASILDRIDLEIPNQTIVGVVGESGCGKTTLVKAILGILPPAAQVEHGDIIFGEDNLAEFDEQSMNRQIRGSKIGFIPQDPYLAFNPVFRVGTQLLEIMRWHAPSDGVAVSGMSARRAIQRRHRELLCEMLTNVGVPEPDTVLERYPHQFSGGQRQRLLIAAALVCRPKLVIADEPTTALDVTTQLQILNLLKRLVKDRSISMMIVTHDFGVVAQLCDYVSVIYAGQSVEQGSVEEIINNPRHPYTRALIACHPDKMSEQNGIPGRVPSPLSPPTGCRFHPRCSSAMDVCREAFPAAMLGPDRYAVRCALYGAR
jgi:peptide/nickel transport system ATP-binding protein